MALGPLHFTFAVIADSHVEAEEAEMLGEAGGGRGSNSRTNNRNRQIVRMLNALAPAFVVHLGDHVDTVPAQPSYAQATRSMRGVFRDLAPPLYLTPGNVDVGDKPVPWMPAAPVTPDSLAAYRAAFGADRFTFTHADCRFIVINASLLNTGLAEEQEQKAWLESELSAAPQPRSFLFTHYPFYLVEPGEDGHYDNIDEPARAWILDLVTRAGVEAVFAGHVHNFFYNRQGRTENYVLPSTAFVRRDYSEMFRVGPADEAGRNDPDKVGFFLVDVHAHGHVARFLRSRGITSDIERSSLAPLADRRLHPKHRQPQAAGVDLRHAWCETTALPYTSPVDEFVRKRARNDYGVQALWDLGIRDLRLPLRDLDDGATRDRVADLAAIGHRFTVFSAGPPDDRARATLARHGALIDAWDVSALPSQLPELLPGIEEAAGAIPVYLSKLWSSAEEHRAASRFRYHVTAGFSAMDGETIRGCIAGRAPSGPLSGLGFRIAFGDALLTAWQAVDALRSELGLRALLSLSLAPSHPSDANRDEIAIAHRVALAVAIGRFAPDTRLFLDTFVEVDRGYFVRSGLLDRRYTLADAGHVWRTLSGALAATGEGARLSVLADGHLAIPHADGIDLLLGPRRPVTALPPIGDGGDGRGFAIDLRSGARTPITWSHRMAGGVPSLALEPAIRSPWPVLVTLERARLSA